ECPHLITLSLEVTRGHLQRPYVAEDHADLIRRKGEEHEAAYLKELHARGRQVVSVLSGDPWNFATSARHRRSHAVWCRDHLSGPVRAGRLARPREAPGNRALDFVEHFAYRSLTLSPQ